MMMKTSATRRTTDTIEATARAVREGVLDPVDLVEDALSRAAEAHALNAIVHLDEDGARRAARGHDRKGPLAGVPVLVKEIIEVEGLPFRCGSCAFEDRVGERDAAVVRRLRDAGAVILGLSHSHEFAFGATGTSNRVGACRNPHDLSRMAGGSSAGSAAAVAAGIVSLALGTDTAGSIRVPAALCGVVGAKPARATLSVDGVFPFAKSLDTVGVLTASVADARYALGVLAGHRDVLDQEISSPRLGLVSNPEPLDSDAVVAASYAEAISSLREAGASTAPVQLPDWGSVTTMALDVQGPEVAAVHAGLATDRYQPELQELLRGSAATPGWRYVRAQEDALSVTASLTEVLNEFDAILLPAVPIVAPLLDASDVPNGASGARERLLRNTRLANVTGHPAISVPLLVGESLPAGLQIIAADNAHLWRVAAWIERALRH